MGPHYKFARFLIINHFRTFQYFGGVQVMIRIVFNCRKYNTLKFPIQQVFRRVTTYSGHIRTITLPRSPVRQNGFPFLVFAIPIVGPFVVKKAAAMGVDGIAVGVFPYFPGYDCGIFRLCFCFCRWQAAKAGQQCKTPNNFPFHLRIRY